MLETYVNEDGETCCDNCSQPTDECTCRCVVCGDSIEECVCDEGPTYPAVGD